MLLREGYTSVRDFQVVDFTVMGESRVSGEWPRECRKETQEGSPSSEGEAGLLCPHCQFSRDDLSPGPVQPHTCPSGRPSQHKSPLCFARV